MMAYIFQTFPQVSTTILLTHTSHNYLSQICSNSGRFLYPLLLVEVAYRSRSHILTIRGNKLKTDLRSVFWHNLILLLCVTDSSLSQNLLLQHSGLFFVPLALAMVNDDSARCKKMAAVAIKSLLSQLDQQHQNTLFTLVNTWLSGDKVWTWTHTHTRISLVFLYRSNKAM